MKPPFSSSNRKSAETSNTQSTKGVYVTLDELVRLGVSAKGFSFLPRQPIQSVLSGRHASRLRGRGMDFNELKPYQQGDDTRNIDWKATRRSGKSYVRVYNEERDRSVWVLVSQQSGMFFGSSLQLKSVSAAHAAALSLFRVIGVGDRVGAIVYNDSRVSMFKAQKNQQNVMRILQEIVLQNNSLNASLSSMDVADKSGQLNAALKHVVAAARHDDLIVLIGDGSGVNGQAMQHITRLAAHNDILALMIYDPLEQKLPEQGSLLFSDANQFVDINTSDRNFQRRFTALFADKLLRLESASRSRAIPLMKISTHRPVLEQIQRALGNIRSAKFKQRAS